MRLPEPAATQLLSTLVVPSGDLLVSAGNVAQSQLCVSSATAAATGVCRTLIKAPLL